MPGLTSATTPADPGPADPLVACGTSDASGRVYCPVTAAVAAIGGKWKPVIVYQLLEGTLRFGELRRRIPQATPQMLTLQLRELEADGLVHREVYRQVPPKTEYSLTALGRRLEPVLQAMTAWGAEFLGRVPTAG